MASQFTQVGGPLIMTMQGGPWTPGTGIGPASLTLPPSHSLDITQVVAARLRESQAWEARQLEQVARSTS